MSSTPDRLSEWWRPVIVPPLTRGEAVPGDRLAAPRCPECCEHGIPWKSAGNCLWCEDILNGHDSPIAPQDPQWLCPHGVGEDLPCG